MMKSPGNSLTKLMAAGLSALLLASIGPKAEAQSSLSSETDVHVGNPTPSNGSVGGFTFASQSAQDNSPVMTSATQPFPGLDGSGQPQTMTFTGQAAAQSDYTGLHVNASASLTNSYYNVNNRPYTDQNGNRINYGAAGYAGSPTALGAASFAGFSDTLQYGGALQSGYMARYLFQVDGTNSGTGTFAFLSVGIDANPGDVFSAYRSGSLSTTWATKDYAVNGVSPQKINVLFSAQLDFTTFGLTDGQNYAGASNFSDTATLAGIELVDQNGALASGWTVTSASGTKYNAIQGTTPAPSSALTLLLGAIPGVGVLLRRRRQRSHR